METSPDPASAEAVVDDLIEVFTLGLLLKRGLEQVGALDQIYVDSLGYVDGRILDITEGEFELMRRIQDRAEARAEAASA